MHFVTKTAVVLLLAVTHPAVRAQSTAPDAPLAASDDSVPAPDASATSSDPVAQAPDASSAPDAMPQSGNSVAKLACADALSIYELAAGGADQSMPPAPEHRAASSPSTTKRAAERESNIVASEKRLANAIRKYGDKGSRAVAAYRLLARDY